MRKITLLFTIYLLLKAFSIHAIEQQNENTQRCIEYAILKQPEVLTPQLISQSRIVSLYDTVKIILEKDHEEKAEDVKGRGIDTHNSTDLRKAQLLLSLYDRRGYRDLSNCIFRIYKNGDELRYRAETTESSHLEELLIIRKNKVVAKVVIYAEIA